MLLLKNKSDIGICSVIEHKIDTAGAAPIRQPVRRTPPSFEGEEEQYLKDQLEQGVIKPSKSAWASGVVLVRKKDGSVRWCVDYRGLNMVTVKDAYPLPKISMCLDCLANASIFSVCDLQAGYWQLKVSEQDQDKTAFITKYGLYEYAKMPFGLCNAPSTFQRCMELIFRGLQWKTLLIYLDDIIIFSSNLDDHFQILDEVLTKLKKSGLKLKPTKCDFLKDEVLYIGHVVSKDGVSPNPKVVESVKNWKVPDNVKKIQQFLGLCNYYRQFVLNFSEVASPLSKLTQKNVEFIWSPECQSAFEKLKSALCNAPVLSHPLPNTQFILDTDASNVGIGAVLSQTYDGKERVISYGSKKLDKHQQRYSVTRRELLAVITFVHQFRHYLTGKKFLLRTDHGSLRWLFSFKDPQGQVARWLEFLSEYNFEIQHRPGVKHQNADALSRKDVEEPLCSHQKEGLTNFDCTTCKEMIDDWSEFKNDVDNIVNLGYITQSSHSEKIRAVTRSQNSKLIASNWLNGYSTNQLETFQREDNDLKPIHQWMDSQKIPNRDDIVSLSPSTRKYWLNFNLIERKNGVLYQKRLSLNSDVSYQLLVPKILRKEVIESCHNALYAAHFGINKTLDKVKFSFHWYKMGEDIKDHVKTCSVCNRNKSLPKKSRASLQTYISGYPMDRVALDVIGPLPRTKSGNRFILVIGDHFTRWMEAFPLPDQQAERVAGKLVHEFMSRFGIPLEIHTDQGRNFESSLFKEICRLFEVKKTRSTPYRPCSNGIIEKFNATLEKMIHSFVGKNINEWDNYIGILMSAYRSMPHPATGFTPNMMMLGREVLLPNHLLFPFPQNPCHDTTEYVSNLRSQMEDIYHTARQSLQVCAQKQKRDYDSRIMQNQYSRGSVVLKFNELAQKFQNHWSGPFIVEEVISPVLYKVRNRQKSEIIHHDKLRAYQSEDLPSWIQNFKRNL